MWRASRRHKSQTRRASPSVILSRSRRCGCTPILPLDAPQSSGQPSAPSTIASATASLPRDVSWPREASAAPSHARQEAGGPPSDLPEVLVARSPGVLESPLLPLQEPQAHHALQVAVPHVGELIPLWGRKHGRERPGGTQCGGNRRVTTAVAIACCTRAPTPAASAPRRLTAFRSAARAFTIASLSPAAGSKMVTSSASGALSPAASARAALPPHVRARRGGNDERYDGRRERQQGCPAAAGKASWLAGCRESFAVPSRREGALRSDSLRRRSAWRSRPAARRGRALEARG